MIVRNIIGERIGFFRRLHNYTQKELGKLLGFSDKTCDVRVAQYESGDRVPKEEMLKNCRYIRNQSLRFKYTEYKNLGEQNAYFLCYGG